MICSHIYLVIFEVFTVPLLVPASNKDAGRPPVECRGSAPKVFGTGRAWFRGPSVARRNHFGHGFPGKKNPGRDGFWHFYYCFSSFCVQETWAFDVFMMTHKGAMQVYIPFVQV